MCNEGFSCPKCHKIAVDVRAELAIRQICDEKQFMDVFTYLSLLKDYPEMHPTNEKLFCAKYDVRLKTLAMNEFLGRPVPNVINFKAIFLEAVNEKHGNEKIARFDKILGFVNDDDEDIEMFSFKQQLQMNDIMINLLKAEGTDFDLIVGAIKNFKMEGILKLALKKTKEKKRKITKMKLRNQRKLGAVEKNDADKPVQDSKNANDSGKIKTAKDFEHYRKSKRPIRI